jgi:hypothetical protein
MAVERTVHEKLEYLTQNTGRRETEVLAEALEQGLDEIYRKHITAAYQAGTMSREEAVAQLGENTVAEIDYAWHAITQDIKWGMSGE